MDERNWELAGILGNYLDDVFEKIRIYGAEWFKYGYDQEKIEPLKAMDIRKMAAAPDAVEQMLIARAGYKTFVVVAYLSGNDEDFKGSLQRLEDTAGKTAAGRPMPTRPRFIEEILAA